MHSLLRLSVPTLALTFAVTACGPGHEAAYIGPSVELEFAFPDASPDRLWSAVTRVAEAREWPVDAVSESERRLVSGWMPAPQGSTDCGSYREVPGNIDAFEDEEYRVRLTVTAGEEEGSRVRIWSDHRATGWYGEEVVEGCVTTGLVQTDVHEQLEALLRDPAPPSR